MRRGFKADAERRATEVRAAMGLGQLKPLDTTLLVEHLNAELRPADQLTSRAKLERLEELQPRSFSACTFTVGPRTVIVYSPLAAVDRRRSDISHEASHLLLAHSVTEVEQLGGLSFFTCNTDEEQEANWLAGCLLLPRDLLLRAVRRGHTPERIAQDNEVSLQMATFRLRTTGVERQAEYFRRR